MLSADTILHLVVMLMSKSKLFFGHVAWVLRHIQRNCTPYGYLLLQFKAQNHNGVLIAIGWHRKLVTLEF
jgi:hypothetical protein